MDLPVIKYPIYIVSKNRHDTNLTAKFFQRDEIDFLIAVEDCEYDKYLENTPKENILRLPFSNLGLGSYPARNYCWEDSIKKGFKSHWVFDDNIRGIQRLNKGLRKRTNGRYAISYLESFHDKFSNLLITGFNYKYFVTRETKKRFVLNTHVYSSLLIRNNIPFRWRLKYNEDIDLCLQVLNSGFCTALFNQFLIEKTSTVAKMKGGNQDELYKNNAFEKKLLKAEMLYRVWPQYVNKCIRFGRPHHYINWKVFKHGLSPINIGQA